MKSKRPLLTIPDSAKGALTGKPQEKIARPVHPAIRQACDYTMRRRVFGERMAPTFRERLLLYSSFSALLSGQ